MGNSDSKKSSPTCNARRIKKSKSFGFSDFSLVNIASNLSSLSYRSSGTQRSNYSATRPWSRVSRSKWRQATLDNPLEACKTAWPVPRIEAAFLPEFKLKKKNDINFEFVDVIAKGAFGQVFKVKKTDNNDYYAMKVLSKAQIISDDAVQQVKDEVRIQSMCGHNPFIVNCPYFWQSHKKIYIVSTYVSGGELLALCQQYGPLPEDLAALYIAEIALALDFLHNSGVIYRDLKLENVLLDELGHVQLIDFGLAKWLSYNKRTRTICGTLQYMAPEILSVDSINGYGHAVDWWSLGVIACVLITSKFPPVILRRMAELISRNRLACNSSDGQSSGFTPIIMNLKGENPFVDNKPSVLNNAHSELVSDSTDHVTHLDMLNSNTDLNRVNKNYQTPTKPNHDSDFHHHYVSKIDNEIVDAEYNLNDMEMTNEVLKIYSEDDILTIDFVYSDGAKDLIQRLLNPDPQKRLRSLLTLQTIRFFKDINFTDIRMKKVAPVDILRKYFPNGPIKNKNHERKNIEDFFNFDLDLFCR